MGPILSAVSLLAVILLVLAAAYVFTRWAGKNMGGGLIGGLGSGRRLTVLDRASLGRDQSLLVVQAGERWLLLGSTPAGVTLLAELTEEEGKLWLSPSPPKGSEQINVPDFRALLQRLREKK